MIFESIVTDIRLASRDGSVAVWWMSLEATLFEPGDHGALEAVTRGGTRLEIPVSAVVTDEEGVMWHVVEKPLAAGTQVTARVSR